MSISSVEIIINRIASATKDSPIAVFDTTQKYRYGLRVNVLDAFFANTVVSQAMIRADIWLIGVFDNTMDREIIRNKLSYFANR